MEYFVLIYICFAKVDMPVVCINLEKNPQITYKTLEECKIEADRLYYALPIEFKKENWIVYEIEAGCIEKPSNKQST